MQRYLVSTLALSLLLTLPVLACSFYFLLRDAKGTFYALVPNLWPVLLILGAMGWFGVPLDIATVMVASITLGLVVDDTIHTLAHYRDAVGRARRTRRGRRPDGEDRAGLSADRGYSDLRVRRLRALRFRPDGAFRPALGDRYRDRSGRRLHPGAGALRQPPEVAAESGTAKATRRRCCRSRNRRRRGRP